MADGSSGGGAGAVPGVRPVACVGHAHVCPIHGPGVIISGSSSCKIKGKPVARIGDAISCGATIITGARYARLDNGRPVARLGDKTDHGGEIVEGDEYWRVE